MNEWRKKVEETIELLCREFPQCFVQFERQRRPLKVGILDDILARLGDRIDRQQLGPALRFYVNNVFYRRAQRAGVPRIDLDGNESGTVSEADAASAAAAVAQHKATRMARKQQTVAPPVETPPVEPVPTEEVVSAPPPAPEPVKRLAGLSELREAAKRRKAAMA
jgi:ProP effector